MFYCMFYFTCDRSLTCTFPPFHSGYSFSRSAGQEGPASEQWRIQDLPKGEGGHGERAEREPKRGSGDGAPCGIRGSPHWKLFVHFYTKIRPKVKDLSENLPPCLESRRHDHWPALSFGQWGGHCHCQRTPKTRRWGVVCNETQLVCVRCLCLVWLEPAWRLNVSVLCVRACPPPKHCYTIFWNLKSIRRVFTKLTV